VILRSENENIEKRKELKRKKEVEKKEIEVLWRGTVRKLISNNKRPYWNSLKG